MAVKRSTSTAQTEKLTVAQRVAPVFIDTVSIKKNVKGTEYIPTPEGAVYSRINEVQPGLHMIVKLSNGALALNRPNRTEIMQFISAQKEETGWTVAEIREFYGL